MDSTSKSLGQHLRDRTTGLRPSFLHRFSDSGLHTGLMVAVIALATLALVQAVSMGVAVWQLDPVVVQGSSAKR